jgi:hypothetical protein
MSAVVQQVAPLPVSPDSVLAYSNPDLLERIMEKEGIDEATAQVLYRDMLQFLYIAGTSGGEVYAPTSKVDVAWHHFILFTHDYEEFCYKYFGTFIHHVPNTKRRMHLVGTGLLPKTIQKARSLFGQLSANWTGKDGDDSCVTDCEKCSGHTNCNNK